MKKIFTFIIAIVAIAAGLPTQAQYFTVGPEVGYERAHHQISGSQYKDVTTRPGDGIRVGGTASYIFKNGLFLRSGLYYSHRGGARMYGVNDSKKFPHVKDIQLKTTDFLTLPLTIGYELPFCSGWGVGIEAGGYVASGLGMGNSFFKCSNNEGSAGSVFDDSLFTVATPDGYDREKVTVKASDRIDAGCAFGAHVSFNRIKLRASYQLGLCKTIYDMAIPRTFTISLSYDFKL
ncbi:MAG: PorT family protein [Muribaculaceae bacterium]|nr:PorT family protein [Muribaculaceae bacterium]